MDINRLEKWPHISEPSEIRKFQNHETENFNDENVLKKKIDFVKV